MNGNKSIRDISYEEAVIADLRAQGHPETTIEIVQIWFTLTPEQKRIAKARLSALDAKHKAGQAV